MFVVVVTDQATCNIALVWKEFYASVIARKIRFRLNNTTSTYIEINNNSKDEILNIGREYRQSKFSTDNIAIDSHQGYFFVTSPKSLIKHLQSCS